MGKVKYKKPSIKAKEIKLNFFSNNARFLDSVNAMIVPPVFAQSECGECEDSQCQCASIECFLKGTQILMNDGSTKPIEEVKIGDKLKSYNTKSQSLTVNTVVDLLIHENPKGHYLVINNILKVTAEHMLFVNGSWESADSIQKQDVLIDSKGNELVVESIETKHDQLEAVFNIHTEEVEHNYFAEGILVHNMKAGCDSSQCETSSSLCDGCAQCFLKGTKILMADGSEKAIEDIKEGDIVKSFNTQDKTLVERKVLMLITHENSTKKYMVINNKLKVTDEHPLFINENFLNAREVKVGDKLIDPSGKEVEVTNVEYVKNTLDTVYNLEVEGPEHNYFAQKILVHNKV